MLVLSRYISVAAFVMLTQIVGCNSGDADKSKVTASQITRFGIVFRSDGLDRGVLRGPTISQAAKELKADPVFSNTFEIDWQMFLNDKDSWGRPFVFQLLDDHRRAIIRSVGPNGKDENGQGDDIQYVIDIRQ